jgi:hypothetical protein
MAQVRDTSLEARIASLEAVVRSQRSSNLTDRAAVVNASGRYVPLSALAFGQVAAVDLTQFTLTANEAAWKLGAPALDVYVTGGKLRVDVAARIVTGGFNLRMGMSYRLTGPTAEPSDAGAEVRAPNESRALLLKNQQGAFAEMAAGFPDLVEGLNPGWYRVQGAYQLLGELNDPADTFGAASNRRLFATPL